MVLFAMPPEDIRMLPPELTVVLLVIPPSSTVIELFMRMMPLLDSPLEIMYAICQFKPYIKKNKEIQVVCFVKKGGYFNDRH